MSNSLRQITALIVGGGPVGRIIGKHLKMSGVDDIGLLLKPKYAAIADQGFELHQLQTMKKKRLRNRYDDFKIIRMEELSRVHYDHVYICLSGPELRTGWLEQAWPHLRHSLWVSCTPGLDDYDYLLRTIPERYIVLCKPGFIAYDAPLPGEDISPPGTAFWYPPWQMTLFKAHDVPTAAMLARMFEKGGLPCGVASDFEAQRLYDSAAAVCFAAALEIHNWDLLALRNDATGLARLCVTQGEVGNAILQRTGFENQMNRRLRKPFWWKLILKYMDNFMPMSLSGYMQHHFMKHRRQMEQQFGDFVRLVRDHGVEPTGTESLAREWARRRGAVAERSFDHLMPMGSMVANTASRSVFSESGELGGEARGKAAADAKGMQINSSAVHIQAPADGSQQFPSRPNNPTEPVSQQQIQQAAPGGYQQYQQHPGHQAHPGQQGHPGQTQPQTHPAHQVYHPTGHSED